MGVIATMFDGRTRLAHQVVDEVRETYDLEVLEPPMPKSVQVAEAPAQGPLGARPRAALEERRGLPRPWPAV